MRCPHCGREIETQQKRAAESRWSSMTKAERAAEMSRVRKLGVKRAKTKARALRQNMKLCEPGGPERPNSKQT